MRVLFLLFFLFMSYEMTVRIIKRTSPDIVNRAIDVVILLVFLWFSWFYLMEVVG